MVIYVIFGLRRETLGLFLLEVFLQKIAFSGNAYNACASCDTSRVGTMVADKLHQFGTHHMQTCTITNNSYDHQYTTKHYESYSIATTTSLHTLEF